MKKKILIGCVVFTLVGLCCLYYYYPRKVSFELVKVIDKPCKEYDKSHWFSFGYVQNKERLKFWMIDYYHRTSCVEKGIKGYDSIFVENLSKELDFEKYDYIIAYQKQIKELKYSPYLTKTEDGLYFDKRTPLIATWGRIKTNKVYIYQIKKNENFRAPGP